MTGRSLIVATFGTMNYLVVCFYPSAVVVSNMISNYKCPDILTGSKRV